jgi:hypothetical protein
VGLRILASLSVVGSYTRTRLSASVGYRENVRFIIAIAVFVVAAALLGVGVAQKIIFSGPSSITVGHSAPATARYVVIDGSVARAHEGIQSLTAQGASSTVVAYGRTADVLAWIGTSPYQIAQLSGDGKSLELSDGKPAPAPSADLTVKPSDAEAKIVDPAGSDLWLDEQHAEGVATLPMNLSDDMSAIIASNGVDVAPGIFSLSWPLPNPAPFATSFIIAGGALAVLGLILYIWALRHLRAQNGPRRRGRLPKPPKSKAINPPMPKSLEGRRAGRRSAGRRGMVAVGLGAVVAFGLAGCSPYQSGQNATTPTPTATSASVVPEIPPAVTSTQLGRIVTRISADVTSADAAMNDDRAATRLVGPALEARLANYALRRADAAQPAIAALPASPLTFIMPQATAAWPRVVMTVVQDETNPSVPTTGLVLVQNSPRANYHVEYAVTLEPNAQVPQVAPAAIGSALVQPSSKLLLIAPDQLSAAYGSVLMQGLDSPSAKYFDLGTDTLAPQIGRDYKEQKKAAVSDRASLEFTQSAGSGQPLALATLDSGAIVSVGLNEVETVKPTVAGASVSPEGQAKVLSGVTSSTTGIESTYGLQLTFYVPPVGSTEKIRLLGYSQGLISAKGL